MDPINQRFKEKLQLQRQRLDQSFDLKQQHPKVEKTNRANTHREIVLNNIKFLLKYAYNSN